jgi:hypothetical protein
VRRGVKVFGYANSHYAGHAPATVQRFRDLWNGKSFPELGKPRTQTSGSGTIQFVARLELPFGVSIPLVPLSTESRILPEAVCQGSLQANTYTEQLFQIEAAPHRTFSHGLTFGFHGPLTFDQPKCVSVKAPTQ